MQSSEKPMAGPLMILRISSNIHDSVILFPYRDGGK